MTWIFPIWFRQIPLVRKFASGCQTENIQKREEQRGISQVNPLSIRKKSYTLYFWIKMTMHDFIRWDGTIIWSFRIFLQMTWPPKWFLQIVGVRLTTVGPQVCLKLSVDLVFPQFDFARREITSVSAHWVWQFSSWCQTENIQKREGSVSQHRGISRFMKHALFSITKSEARPLFLSYWCPFMLLSDEMLQWPDHFENTKLELGLEGGTLCQIQSWSPLLCSRYELQLGKKSTNRGIHTLYIAQYYNRTSELS